MYYLQTQQNTALPANLLERYRQADGPALKTAIFLLQNGEADEAILCRELALSPQVAARCLSFWAACGLIGDKQPQAAPACAQAQDQPAEAAKPAVAEAAQQPLKPARRHLYQSDMAAAVLGDPAMASLLQETQRLLGKQLSVSESRLLFELSEENGLPASVILILVSYWAATVPTKKVLTETARTARDWAELDIRTPDAADAAVARMEQQRAHQASVAKVLGREGDSLTRAERRRIDEWFENFGYDEAFVSEVLLRKPDAGIPYIHTVFKSWHRSGYRTVSDTRVTPVNAQPTAPAKGSLSGMLFQRAIAKNNQKEEER